jgi:tetratricopeptide (TPR) repeat protein
MVNLKSPISRTEYTNINNLLPFRLTTSPVTVRFEDANESSVKPFLKPLSFEDVRRLRAAEGWLELGDANSADDELKEISSGEQTHPAVLQVRYAIYAKHGQWDIATDVAGDLANELPDDAQSWINLAYATRRKTGGGIHEAKKILQAAEPLFSGDCVIPFNLACYCSQLREFEQAEQWLKKAAAIDGKLVRKLAVDDPDLKPLWDSRGGMIWGKES